MSGCGTANGYRNGCRCDRCREAQRVRRLELRRAKGIGPRKPAKHGSTSMYTNNKCRCALCTEAQRVYVLEYRHKGGIRERV